MRPSRRSGAVDGGVDGALGPQEAAAGERSAELEPNAAHTFPEFLSVEELSTLLRVNHKTLRDAMARGQIPGVRRIGGVIRIHRRTVVNWFTSGQGSVSRSKRSQ